MYKFIFNGKKDDATKIYTCIEEKGELILYEGHGVSYGYTKKEFIKILK